MDTASNAIIGSLGSSLRGSGLLVASLSRGAMLDPQKTLETEALYNASVN
jgi:hypothetical protein